VLQVDAAHGRCTLWHKEIKQQNQKMPTLREKLLKSFSKR